MKKFQIVLLSLIAISTLNAQDLNWDNLKDLSFRNIGPAGMSGRITALDVNFRDKDHIYVG